MVRSRKLWVFLVPLVLAQSAMAGGFQLNEHGARAMAQGGAFAARATDGSAIYFNPAGLSFQTRPAVTLGATLISPNTTFYGPLGTSTQTSQVSQLFNPVNLYGTMPVDDRLAVGIGVNNPFGLGTEWPMNWVGQFITLKVDLKTFFISPTVSYRLLDNLSVGVGVNYVTGTVLLRRAVSVTSVALPQTPVVNLDLAASGVSFNAGVLYKPLPWLSVGASYRSETKLDADGTATFTPNYAALAFPAGDAAASITLPATGFAAIAVTPIDNLELEADYQFIGWSSYKELSVEFQKTGQKSTSHKNYEDTYMLRFGAEYHFTRVTLRAGYLFDHSPVKNEYLEPLLPDANRNGFCAGLGYKITDDFSVDLAYMFLRFKTRTVTNSIPENDLNGTYKTYADLLGLNVSYSF
jgi:long-chain fatty acid transport protein